MRVNAHLLEAVLAEGIQQAQLDKVARLLEEDPADLLTMVGMADPTVEVNDEGGVDDPQTAMKAKYGPWLLKQLSEMAKKRRAADWLKNNPEAAVEQNLLRRPEDAPNVVAQRYYNAQNLDWRPNVEDVRQALAAYKKVVDLGRADEVGIESDINMYTLSGLMDAAQRAMQTPMVSKRALKRGKVNPLEFEGSSILAEGPNHFIVRAETPAAAMLHGKDTDWCFRAPNMAKSYTSTGPLYIVYARGDITDLIPSAESEILPGWSRLAAVSPFSPEGPAVDNVDLGDAFWEARDAEDSWLNEVEFLEKEGMLNDFGKIAEDARQVTEPAAIGYEPWREDGREYDNDDIEQYYPELDIRANVSEYADDFMRNWGGEVEDDGTIDVTKFLQGLFGEANADYMSRHHESFTKSYGTYYADAASWDSDMWDNLGTAAAGQLIEGAEDEYLELETAAQYTYWEENWQEFVKALKSQVMESELLDDRNRIYDIPVEVVVEAIDELDGNELYELASEVWYEGHVDWDYDYRGYPTIDFDSVAEYVDIDNVMDKLDLDPDEYEDEPDEPEEGWPLWVIHWWRQKTRDKRLPYKFPKDMREHMALELSRLNKEAERKLTPGQIYELVSNMDVTWSGTYPHRVYYLSTPSVNWPPAIDQDKAAAITEWPQLSPEETVQLIEKNRKELAVQLWTNRLFTKDSEEGIASYLFNILAQMQSGKPLHEQLDYNQIKKLIGETMEHYDPEAQNIDISSLDPDLYAQKQFELAMSEAGRIRNDAARWMRLADNLGGKPTREESRADMLDYMDPHTIAYDKMVPEHKKIIDDTVADVMSKVVFVDMGQEGTPSYVAYPQETAERLMSQEGQSPRAMMRRLFGRPN